MSACIKDACSQVLVWALLVLINVDVILLVLLVLLLNVLHDFIVALASICNLIHLVLQVVLEFFNVILRIVAKYLPESLVKLNRLLYNSWVDTKFVKRFFEENYTTFKVFIGNFEMLVVLVDANFIVWIQNTFRVGK